MSSTTWHNTITTPIPPTTDHAAIVQILHDHAYILSLNTLVTHHAKVRDDGPREVYSITEAIPIIPPVWKRHVTFEATFENRDNGVWTWVTAPMGVVMHAKYEVRAAEGGGWKLVEEIESSCSVLLKAFVERTMVNSHRNMHARFLERATEVRKEGEKKDDDGQVAK